MAGFYILFFMASVVGLFYSTSKAIDSGTDVWVAVCGGFFVLLVIFAFQMQRHLFFGKRKDDKESRDEHNSK
ncbi:MAG: hypothetical protein ACWA5T_04210 [Parvularcula sp.]